MPAGALLAVLLLAGCAGRAPADRPTGPATPGRAALDARAGAWVEETLASLDLRRKAGQLVVPWIPGGYAATDSEDFERLVRLVGRGVGGVSISMGLPPTYVARLNALQRRARVPLLVSRTSSPAGPACGWAASTPFRPCCPSGAGPSFRRRWRSAPSGRRGSPGRRGGSRAGRPGRWAST